MMKLCQFMLVCQWFLPIFMANPSQDTQKRHRQMVPSPTTPTQTDTAPVLSEDL